MCADLSFINVPLWVLARYLPIKSSHRFFRWFNIQGENHSLSGREMDIANKVSIEFNDRTANFPHAS